jgi:site-specific DNA-cytosine methylase
MKVLDLFSGIGGFALGLERAGFSTAAFCELDTFCREWLAQNWPGVPIYPDVRELHGESVGHVDLVAGGFPCQDISAAGNGAGLDGDRSGLWFEMLRIVREVRSRWVLVENVPALRTRGIDVVLQGLEESGYTCWPFVVGADDAGAPHRRKRVWIIGVRLANADRDALRDLKQWMSGRLARDVRDSGETFARDDGEGRVGDADGIAGGCGQQEQIRRSARGTAVDGAGNEGMADAAGESWRAATDQTESFATEGGTRVKPRGGRQYPDDESMANPARGRLRADGSAPGSSGHADECGADVADSDGGRCESVGLQDGGRFERKPRGLADGCGRARHDDRGQGEPSMGDANRAGLEGHAGASIVQHGPRSLRSVAAAGFRVRWPAGPGERQHDWEAPRTVTDAECGLGVSADGIPGHMGAPLNRARLKAAGNSVVPQVVEIMGRVIARADALLFRGGA